MPRIGIGLGPTRRGASFSPLSLAPFAWWDMGALPCLWQDTAGSVAVTTAGDPIARIDDKSGNGRHQTQATVGSQGAYAAGGGVTLDGTADGYGSGSVTWADTGCTVAAVVSQTAAGSYPNIWSIGEAAAGALNLRTVAATARPALVAGPTNIGAGASAAATPAGTTTSILSVGKALIRATLSTSDVWTIWQNSTQRDQRTIAFTGGATVPMYVGSRNGSTPFGGTIHEVLVWNSELSAGDGAAIDAYLTAKWGIV